MSIALLNGSPKVKGSASRSLLEDVKYYLSEKVEILEAELHKTVIAEELLEKLSEADVWVFAFPLYVDGIPGHLLSCLTQLEKVQWKHPGVRIFGIVNCGFYEEIQAETALELLENWCVKKGFIWGGGIGVGGGGGLGQMPSMKNGHGPRGPVDKVLEGMADTIVKRKTQENRYVSVAFPRFLYKMGAQMGWRKMIRANGGKPKDLGRQPG